MPRHGQSEKGRLADQAERDRIVNELDVTMLVEAAAGTGKTTALIHRMVALLETRRCAGVEHLAAVTFTRKAAAELRARFQVALERRAREVAGPARENLARAVRHVERCFIGTIHSFCGRLLRERPVEARVDVAFRELDDTEDARRRQEAWDRYVAALYAADDPLLDELDEMGLHIGELREAFLSFADYPDVQEWPVPEPETPDLERARAELLDYVEHMESLAYPPDAGTDELMPRYRLVALLARITDLTHPTGLLSVLEACGSAKITQYRWPGKDGKARAKAEKARWDAFRGEIVEPVLRWRREARYGVVLRALDGARETYDRLRAQEGVLNFQDLLMRAATLLRENVPHVREYFARRFTHLLVDEFQDTDPIQAEVMLLLTADDSRQGDWRACRPRPGALFVVGDPKQSIYRFRRADIVTYSRVRSIIAQSGGRVVKLSANFRSVAPVRDWVNRAFEGAFPPRADDYSPEYVALSPGRTDAAAAPEQCVQHLAVPERLTRQDDIAAWEADLIARAIRRALDAGEALARTDAERERGVPAAAQPGDFLILARTKFRLSVYARALQSLGIPHQVTGGAALNETSELGLLHLCLSAAVNPHNPVAVVAALRSELFGLSDPALYAFRKRGGEFRPGAPLPDGPPARHREALSDALGRLDRYRGWLYQLPPVAAVERVIADLGLWVRAAAAPGGDVQSGSLAKAVGLLRAAQSEYWTAADLVAYLGSLAASEEKHDALPVRPHAAPPVRVMNLHKAKGLQAPVVFLADPAGESDHPVTLHVDRSGERVRAYMAVFGEKRGRAPRPLLACPAGWDVWAEEEKRFQDAEALRLLYVAATRAGARLVVSQRTRNNQRNPWGPLAPLLDGRPTLEDPGAQRPPAPERQSLARSTVENARKSIAQRWARVSRRTYDVAAAREISLAPGAAFSAGEHGTEWGKVVHLALETLMRAPDADIQDLAVSALKDQEMPVSQAGEVAEVARSVAASPLWRRARRSRRCLVEVPFQVCLEPSTVVRGVIDLAFEEPDGWVIVDYKSGDLQAGDLTALVARYMPQVEYYAEAWRRCTGAKVKEAGLYFTHSGHYVPKG